MHKFKRIKAGTADINKLWEKIYLTILALYVGFNTLFYYNVKDRMAAIFLPGIYGHLPHTCRRKDNPYTGYSKEVCNRNCDNSICVLMSHYVSGYGLPFDLLMLLIGSYKVDFKKYWRHIWEYGS